MAHVFLQANYTAQQAEEAWLHLDDAIEKIEAKLVHTLSYQDLYNTVYKLVVSQYGEFVYRRLELSLQRVFARMVEALREYEPGEALLERAVEVWEDAKELTEIVRSIFPYLEKNYAAKEAQLPVKVLAYQCFFELLCRQNVHILQNLTRTVLTEIERERSGERINEPLLRRFMQLMVELGTTAELRNSRDAYYSVNYEYETKRHVYEQYYERALLEDTEHHYSTCSLLLLKESTWLLTDYLIIAEKYFYAEKKRVEAYLDACTETRLLQAFLNAFVTAHAQQLLEIGVAQNGFEHLLDSHELDHLHRLFFIFAQSTDTLKILKEAFHAYITNFLQKNVLDVLAQCNSESKNVAEDANLAAATIIKTLLAFKEKIDGVLERAFTTSKEVQEERCGETGQNLSVSHYQTHLSGGKSTIECASSKQLRRETKDVFIAVLNENSLYYEHLAQHIDFEMRKQFKMLSVDEQEGHLRRLFPLFKLIRHKDAFKHAYKRLLAERLIENASVSDEMERFFISLLKMECGVNYTAKLEAMFNDVLISRELNEEVRPLIRQLPFNNNTFELEVNVFSEEHGVFERGNGEQSAVPSINFPEVLIPYMHWYEEFYLTKRKETTLKFFYEFGSANVRANYDASGTRKKELQVSTVQMLVLALFNKHDSLTAGEIRQATNIPFELLAAHILPLAALKILTYERRRNSAEPEDAQVSEEEEEEEEGARENKSFYQVNEIGPQDLLSYNANFEHKSFRIKVPIARVPGDMAANARREAKQFLVERQEVVDSLIVKVMKARKKLAHDELVSAILKLAEISHFQPDSTMIKRSIETLITRDYLKREGEQGNVYAYVV